MNRYALLTAVVLSTLLCSLAARAEGPRIGILSDAASRKEADLLMVELQKVKCELVERDQIAKVLGEQVLQIGLGRQDSQRVGQMLKADGLVLISAGTNDMITVRFVAVAPGVMLWFGDCSAKNGVALSKTLAVTLAPFLPKLAVKKSEALPISLLRIRPGLGTVQAAQLATELYRLLQLRLVREPALFVLERDNLRQMHEEQRWAGKDSEFWAGSYLVDGSVRHDVIETNQVTLSLVVRPPATAGKTGTAAATIEETGRIDELTQLIDRATVKVCAGFGARATAAAWDPAQEGAQFAALAGRLLDPAQAKVALEAAMALGCRDQKTAQAYAAALRAVALRGGHPAHIELAERPHREEQAADLLAYLGFVNSYQPPGGFTPETEKRWLLGYFPPVTTGCDYLVVVHRGEASDELKEWIPKIQEQCRPLLDRTLACAPALAPGATVTRICHYGRYLYPRMADCLNLYRKTGPGVMEQDRVEPVFPTPATEPADQRNALWEAFRRETETTAPVEARFLTWHGKIPAAMDRAMGQADRPHRNALRRQLQDELMKHPEFWPMIVNQDAFIGRYLFPDFQPAAGKMLQYHPPTVDEFSYWFEVKTEVAQEHTERAYQWFLALMKTAPAKLESVRPPPPDSKIVHFPYLAFYSAAQAKEVNNAILARDQQLAAVATTNKTDLTWLRDALAARFPDLADAGQRERQAKQVEATAAAERARLGALRVTREVLNLPASPLDKSSRCDTPFVLCRQTGDQVWFCWNEELFCMNTSTRKYSSEPVPVPMQRFSHGGLLNAGHLAMLDTCIVYYQNPLKGHPDVKNLEGDVRQDFSSCTLAIRRQDQTQWRTKSLPFNLSHVTELKGKIYARIAVPSAQSHAGYVLPTYGIAAIDPVTFQIDLLADPVTSPLKLDRQSTAIVLLRPAPDTGLTATAKELLVRYSNQYCVGWDPTTKSLRRATEAEWLAASTPGPVPYLDNSRRVGFEIVPDPEKFRPGGTMLDALALSVRPVGATQMIDVPLLLDERPMYSADLNRNQDWKGVARVTREYVDPHRYTLTREEVLLFIPTATSILIPYNERSQRRGFWEIPYADIQQWLAANRPAADKPAPKAGESAPAATANTATPAATKGK